jgi:hypothetical protein
MDKQEKKRDVAVFANMLKDMMNEPESDLLITLDRDLQHFIFGRIAVLVKHNDGQPIGSVGDLGAIVGGAFAAVLGEFLDGRVSNAEDLQKLVVSAKENMVEAFQNRAPVLKAPQADQGGDITATEEKVEATDDTSVQ